jgi:ribonuclease Z
MGKVIVLGSGYAVPDEQQDNTHLLVQQDKRVVLIDTASNPILRLQRAGVAFDDLSDLILTHFHPDHVSGVPLLLMGMWLLGRKRPLDIFGLEHTIDRIKAMINLYELLSWPKFYQVNFYHIPEKEMSVVIDDENLRILASPVKHLIPTIGLRLEFEKQKHVVVYSCDTEPCQQVIQLAAGADILIHEAAGASLGHSSPVQAAEVAVKARAKMLYLIHYSRAKTGLKAAVEEAKAVFPGPVILTEDFLELALD